MPASLGIQSLRRVPHAPRDPSRPSSPPPRAPRARTAPMRRSLGPPNASPAQHSPQRLPRAPTCSRSDTRARSPDRSDALRAQSFDCRPLAHPPAPRPSARPFGSRVGALCNGSPARRTPALPPPCVRRRAAARQATTAARMSVASAPRAPIARAGTSLPRAVAGARRAIRASHTPRLRTAASRICALAVSTHAVMAPWAWWVRPRARCSRFRGTRYTSSPSLRACHVRACSLRACSFRACSLRACTLRACTLRACSLRAHFAPHGTRRTLHCPPSRASALAPPRSRLRAGSTSLGAARPATSTHPSHVPPCALLLTRTRTRAAQRSRMPSSTHRAAQAYRYLYTRR